MNKNYILEFGNVEYLEYFIFYGPETNWDKLCEFLIGKAIKETLEKKSENPIDFREYRDLLIDKLEERGYVQLAFEQKYFCTDLDYNEKENNDYGKINTKIVKKLKKVNKTRKNNLKKRFFSKKEGLK